ncbi:MAG: hypothetical protein HOE30_08500 [Deltaproteobacteria bacterium]|nr:hypothetical protein [Deltaproteobacteria bacterium]
MSERDEKLSSLSHTTRKKALQLSRWIASDESFQKANLLGDVFETGRSQERQNELVRQGNSWIGRSPHQNGTAFDLVLCYKLFKPLRITKFFWDNSKFYERLQEKAHELGLFSYGLVYKKDAFHFELPIIWQPESDCYAYAVINALRWKDTEWRRLGKSVAAVRAERLQQYTKKKNLGGTLQVAKDLLWICDFEEVEPEDIENTGCYVVQTRNVFLGDDKVAKQKERVRVGQGIAGHATAVAEKDKKGIWTLNSHEKTYPAQYCISDFSQISKAYKIII